MSSSLFAQWIADETNAAAGPALFAPAAADGFQLDAPREPEPERVTCPHCSKRCRVPAGANLARARCPRCNNRIGEKPAAAPVAPAPVDPAPEPLPAPAKPAPAPEPRRGKLVDVYRPRTIADLHGQDWARDALTEFLRSPSPGAFVFTGPTGTGKTSAALALAAELGVAVEWAECGGLYQISSGEQTGESVRDAVRGLRCRPMYGNGWRVLIVNEADCMTQNAAYTWLDVLENLPPCSVVIFTTNDPQKIPRRLRDRAEEVVFIGGALILRPALQELANRVWKEQTGRDDCPDIDGFGDWSVDGEASFRRLLQLMDPYVRQTRATGMIPPLCVDVEAPDKPARKGKVRS